MNRNISLDGSEVPSIIEEIVIYDKPNKLSVPQEIFPKSTNFGLVKGDIVLSRAKEKTVANSSKARESKGKQSKILRDVTVKNEVLETEEIVEPESGNQTAIETSYEILYEYTEDDSSELEGSIENKRKNISKEISKTDVKLSSFTRTDVSEKVTKSTDLLPSPKEDTQATKNSNIKAITNQNQDNIKHGKKIKLNQGNKESAKTPSGKASKEGTPFKKPRGRPRKFSVSPQKSTLSNFLNKRPTAPNEHADQEKNEQLTDMLKNTPLVPSEITEKKKNKPSAETPVVPNEDTQKRKNNQPTETEYTQNMRTIYITQNNRHDNNCKKEIIVENVESNVNEAIVQTNEISADNNIMVEVRQKRVRRRPKKFDDHEVLVGGSLIGQGLDEELSGPSLKKKKGSKRLSQSSEAEALPKLGIRSTGDIGFPRLQDTTCTQGAGVAAMHKMQYAELTIVPVYNENILNGTEQTSDLMINSENLDELLDEAQEQVNALNNAETELQSLVEGNLLRKISKSNKSAERRVNKTSTKRTKKSDQPKTTSLLKDIKQESGEQDDEMLSVSHEEYESDEDSRKEWVPEEYAEYKQQHVMKQVTKMHHCKFCGITFKTYYGMRKHRALEHDDVGKDWKESTYQPSTAAVEDAQEEDATSDEESRGEWMPQDYADYKMKHTMNKAKRTQWYKCKICCSVFSNYYKLAKHRLEHEKRINPYECKECDDTFGDVESLAAHIRVHQGNGLAALSEGKDPYNCKKCDKGFCSRQELFSHASVHLLKKPPPPPKRFRCDLCGKEFSKLCDIERHTRVHTGEKPCECNICHKRFQQSHNLSKHLLTHLHVKPFQCEICNKKFGRVDVLNRHLLTHSMEKPYKCNFCHKGFIREVQLTHHMEKMHPAECLPDEALDLAELEVTDEVTLTPVL